MESMDTMKKKIEQLEMELSVEKKKYQIIKDYSNCALWEYDIANKRLILSRKLDGKYNKTNMVIEHYQQSMHNWGLVHPDDWGVFDAYCASMDAGEEKFQYDTRQVTDEAMFVWLRNIGMTVYDKEGKPVKVVGKTIDVTQEKKEVEALIEKASRDTLTNLYNKGATRELIEKYMKNPAGRENGGAFLIVDVDDFKNVNDTFGHLYGDFVLSQVANVLVMSSAQGDVVGRIGGDEFCIFCKGKNSRALAGEVADKIMFKAENTAMKRDMKMRLSLGIAMFPQDGADYETLYKSADLALYRSKHEGKNSYSFYEARMSYEIDAGETSRKRIAVETAGSVGTVAKELSQIERELFNYSFAAICANENLWDAMELIFSEIGLRFGLNSISLVNCSSLDGEIRVLKEWAGSGIAGESLLRGACLKKYGAKLVDYCRKNELLVYGGREEADEPVKEFLEDIGASSVIAIPIFEGSNLVYLLTYEAARQRNWEADERETLKAITKMLGSYLLRMNMKEEMESELLYMGTSMRMWKVGCYVVTPGDYRLLYVSRHIRDVLPGYVKQPYCYKALMGRNSPCPECPLKNLGAGQKECSVELYQKKTGKSYRVNAKELDSQSMETKYVLSWMDITDAGEAAGAMDKLTGTVSYERFRTEAAERLGESGTYAMAMLGIRNFSAILETYGIVKSDEILRELASHMKQNLTERESLCRLDGDTFFWLIDEEEERAFEKVNHSKVTFEAWMAEKYPDYDIRLYAGIYHIRPEDYYISSICDKAARAGKREKHLTAGNFIAEE